MMSFQTALLIDKINPKNYNLNTQYKTSNLKFQKDLRESKGLADFLEFSRQELDVLKVFINFDLSRGHSIISPLRTKSILAICCSKKKE